MRYVLLILALFCQPALAQWTQEQRTLATVYMTAHVVDWAQTREIAARPDRWREYNPLLGYRPDMAKVNRYFVLAPLLGWLVLDRVDSSTRTTALKVVTAVEVGMVARNAYLGINTRF